MKCAYLLSAFETFIKIYENIQVISIKLYFNDFVHIPPLLTQKQVYLFQVSILDCYEISCFSALSKLFILPRFFYKNYSSIIFPLSSEFHMYIIV